MCDSEDLAAASSNAVLHAKPPTALPCQAKPKVSPIVVVGPPKIVLVKKDYQPKGHRLAVRLGTSEKFTGTGTLSAEPAGQLEVYDLKGARLALPMDIPGAKLSKGVTVYIEAKTPSVALGSTSILLSLVGGDKTIENSPAKDTLTCVEVTVELGQFKPAPGGGDPAPVADKITTGRNLHLQTPANTAGRALLIVKQAKPAAYAGNIILKARGTRLRSFDYGEERPAAGQVALPNPLPTANNLIGAAGRKLWIEGATESSKPLDTGYTLEVSDLPGVEGDRANITVVKVVLDIYDRPTKAGAKPARIVDVSKLDPGRSLHLQNAAGTMGRAKLVVQRVTPSGWNGNLDVEVWDLTANSRAAPKLKLLSAEAAGSPEHNNPIAHSAAFPKVGKPLWVEGVVTSAGRMDTELRLRVADAEGCGDRARVTVHELFVKEIKFNGIADIYYARSPDAGSYILAPAGEPPKHHYAGAQLRPAGGGPHWKKKPAKDRGAEVSWPAVFARKKATGVPAPTLDVKFELYPKVGAATLRIMADGGASGLKTEEKDVAFNAGNSVSVTFAINGLPNTVKRLDGFEFEWRCDGPAHKTKHTLFIVDKMPRAANNGFDDKYLWEIFEWSCRWADGVKGTSNVVGAIWAKFKPAAPAPAHDTGLVYWKNYRIYGPIMPQDLVSAIQRQDPPTPIGVRNGASCIVFDRVLMNCLAAHGVASAEIKLTPDTAPFSRAAVNYVCTGWKDTTIIGQGNPDAPPAWGSHWIAVANVGGWKFYDASYGEGPHKAPEPGAAAATLNVQVFEPKTVRSFTCTTVSVPPAAVDLPRDPNPANPPHLVGTVLWTNK